MGRKKALYEKVSWFLPFVEWPSHKDIKSFLTSILFCIHTSKEITVHFGEEIAK